MVDKFFKFPFTINRFRQGPLAGHIDAFAAQLAEQGYSRVHGQIQLRLIGHFNLWLERKRLTANQLDEDVLAIYLRHLERRKRVRSEDVCTLTRLLRLLRTEGVTRYQRVERNPSPREKFLEEYRRYLRDDRGLSDTTLPNMLMFVDRFLAARYPRDHFDFAALNPRDITTFVREETAELSSGRAKLLVTALRSFFRYLRHRGDIDTDLAGCVPCVADWSFSALPKFLPPGTVERILRHADRTTSRGRRDYAILTLLARLGLRSSEVVGLNLEDIDWKLGQITIRGKGGRWSKLPLPPDVGEAIAAYLRHDRPHCSTRTLFVTRCAPITGLRTHCAISRTVARALARAGIDSVRKGGHLFRHTLATEMLRRGASLSEIGEVLRHRSANTTRIYAKVDLTALRRLALPWPGGGR